MKLNEVKNIKKYNNIPSIFNNIETWVKHSDLKCWYCHLNFELTPIFIPKLIDKSNNGLSIHTKGCFCSFSCAMSYINLHNKDIYDKINDKENYYFYIKYSIIK